MKLLHLDSSILGQNSVSHLLSASAVASLSKAHPGIHITYRDLAARPIPHLSGPYLAAGQASEAQQQPALQADLALGQVVLDEFLAADVIVLGVGFYNFGIPSQLKAWVDRLAIVGKTFRYSEQGPIGLAGGKRVVLTIARGGFYGPDTPTAQFEHAESYLKSIFAFFGITNIEVFAAEGVAFGPEAREAAILQAEEKIAALRA